MKKLSTWARLYMPRLREKRTWRGLRSKAVKRRNRGGLVLSPTVRHAVRKKPVRLVAPIEFCLLKPARRSELLDLCRRMLALTDAGQRVQIDFSRTTLMRPGGTLYFTACVDHIARYHGRRLLRGTRPTDQVVEQVLQQVGLCSRLGMSSPYEQASLADNVRHWRFATGVKAEGGKTAPLLDHYEGRLAAPLKRLLYGGISEAMDNCLFHAYRRADHPKSEEHRWWMFSQEKDGELTVSFCDLGIGIPASISTPEHWAKAFIKEGMARFTGSQPHAEKIRLATELHRTSTNEKHRGKGLRDIINVIRKAEGGYLRILSARGMFSVDGRTGGEKLADIAGTMSGTILEWCLPLHRETDEKNHDS